MMQELLKIDGTESWEDLCTRLGKTLGLDQPVSSSVMRRVMDDPLYAHDLLSCRNTPGFLKVLLHDPRNEAYKPPVQIAEKTTLQLLSKASSALFKWGKAGFSTVDEETYQRRFNTCLQCVHLVEPPDKLLYRLMTSGKPNEKICNLCGCVAAKKARLPTESCPAQRW
jgi:hypothetical protein